ncbi:MAG: hypothetical protein J7K46_11120 [Bacteroidales bacterium]|nr:hypothetical protein [Bacteroidales bacterium]
MLFFQFLPYYYPETEFERYADNIIVHCKNIKAALRMLEAIKKRFSSCKLALNQKKSQIVYCRRNQKRQPPFDTRYHKFDLFGFTFKPRMEKQGGKFRLT